MKTTITLLASLFALLPYGLHGQTITPAKAATAVPVMSVPVPALVGQSREKVADVCSNAPRSDWFPEDEMKLLAQHRGYRIKTFKVANNSCYEVYGFDREGRIVEAYFNPVTTRLVRQNIAH